MPMTVARDSSTETREGAPPRPDRDVLVWRRAQLERSGYPVWAARLLALRGDVDLHQACALVENGCSPERALTILL